MQPPGIFVFVLLTVTLACASPRGDSLRELRKLMRQQDADSLQQFDQDLNEWARNLVDLGQQMAEFVEKCRQPKSHCQKRLVLRQIRNLRRGYTEFRARLEALEVNFFGRVRDTQNMESSLQMCKDVLRQYDETFTLLNNEVEHIVDQ
ncbi:uncharacterized protein Dana_GF14443 [Drosophila ananassae]|uniref:Uncharacterized protein n=1 Tax=Drosophila ananassae TaxID=7217 RepID=B3ML42_DROAN|nr:uncharacterized protein LOC6497267 [Drosophila ananassae]EDV31660.1 uncharacterized protein Dana_GF14443 [Drosophila ananassae]